MEASKKPEPVQLDLNENTLGMVSHLLGIFTSFIGVLVMYLIYKDTATNKLKQNMVNALNWQISLAIYLFVSSVLSIIVIGILGLFALPIVNLVFCILGAIEANKGSVYKYPLSINFIKA